MTVATTPMKKDVVSSLKITIHFDILKNNIKQFDKQYRQSKPYPLTTHIPACYKKSAPGGFEPPTLELKGGVPDCSNHWAIGAWHPLNKQSYT